MENKKNNEIKMEIRKFRIFYHLSRHCGLDPQSPCYLQGIPAFAGMTALIYKIPLLRDK
jgi:hypothetical protein